MKKKTGIQVIDDRLDAFDKRLDAFEVRLGIAEDFLDFPLPPKKEKR